MKSGDILGYMIPSASAGRLSQYISLVHGTDYDDMNTTMGGRHMLQALVSVPTVTTVIKSPPHALGLHQVIGDNGFKPLWILTKMFGIGSAAIQVTQSLFTFSLSACAL